MCAEGGGEQYAKQSSLCIENWSLRISTRLKWKQAKVQTDKQIA